MTKMGPVIESGFRRLGVHSPNPNVCIVGPVSQRTCKQSICDLQTNARIITRHRPTSVWVFDMSVACFPRFKGRESESWCMGSSHAKRTPSWGQKKIFLAVFSAQQTALVKLYYCIFSAVLGRGSSPNNNGVPFKKKIYCRACLASISRLIR